LAEKFPEGEGNEKKTEKLQKQTENSTIKPLPGGGQDRKNSKKDEKYHY